MRSEKTRPSKIVAARISDWLRVIDAFRSSPVPGIATPVRPRHLFDWRGSTTLFFCSASVPSTRDETVAARISDLLRVIDAFRSSPVALVRLFRKGPPRSNGLSLFPGIAAPVRPRHLFDWRGSTTLIFCFPYLASVHCVASFPSHVHETK